MDKKISFGFSKIIKKSSILPTNKIKDTEVGRVELIKCLEGQEIKLVEEKPVEAPLIIPLKENTKTSAAIASLLKRRAVLLGEEDDPAPEEPTGIANSETENPLSDTLEQRAAREILASVQGLDAPSADQNLIVPAKNADELPLDGAKQSSINDYENVPIQQFGKAMLRGMGWMEPIQNKGQPPAEELPFVRPKGMGLGADKALKKQPLLIPPEKNEVLEIKKFAYVRLLGGKHKDMYGQIEGFDDHAGRVIVKMAIGGAKEAFNEFLCQPISKKEFDKYGKCINTAKFEEYKKMENEYGQIIIKKENVKKGALLKEEGDLKREDDICKTVSDRKSYDERRDKLEEERSSCSRRGAPFEGENHKENTKRLSRDHSNRHKSEKRAQLASGSCSRRQQYSDDTSASSDTDSGSDSAYERKHKKKSSHKSKAKKKSIKKAKRKHRHRKTNIEDDSSNSDGDEDDDSYQRKKRQHKKKTKKSKKPRSRSRSHERSNKR